MTLFRYVTKKHANPTVEIRIEPHYDVNQVFTESEEPVLADCIKTCSLMAYGLTKYKVTNWRKLTKNITHYTFVQCSFSRLPFFKTHNIEPFFNKLEEIINRIPELAYGLRIFNLDETSTTSTTTVYVFSRKRN